MKKMNLAKELNVPNSRVYNSIGFLDEIVGLFKRRSREASLINSYQQYASLKEFAYDAFCLRAEHIITDLSDEEKEVLQELSEYYANKSIEDIPAVQETILDDFDFEKSYFRIINMLYEKKVNGKSMVDLSMQASFGLLVQKWSANFQKRWNLFSQMQ